MYIILKRYGIYANRQLINRKRKLHKTIFFTYGKMISDRFNKFYINIGKTWAEKHPVYDIRSTSFMAKSNNESMYIASVTVNGVVKIN